MNRKFHRLGGCAAWLGLVALLGGCAATAPDYQPDAEAAAALKAGTPGSARVSLINITLGAPGMWRLQVQDQRLRSPVGWNYGNYLAQALRSELQVGGHYNAWADNEISGTLLDNRFEVDAQRRCNGAMEARFVVSRNGQIRFDKTKSVTTQSTLPPGGDTTAPAMRTYAAMTRALLSSLMADPEFVAALGDPARP